MGVTLHQSLVKTGQPFHLWILCMDELAEKQLAILALPHVTLISLKEIETQALLNIKSTRSKGEYCWTLTPFLPDFVLGRAQDMERVTYLDADLYFYDTPQLLFCEFDQSGKQVLITEHAYAPEYDQTAVSGRFCVQFLTFRKTPGSLRVLGWWQEKCLEWCFARYEEGKFGDQKYLDCWPDLFGDVVHVLRQTDKTLAPWNVNHVSRVLQGALNPVFYHFHEFRMITPGKMRLFLGYKIGRRGLRLYDTYLAALKVTVMALEAAGIPIPYLWVDTKWESWSFINRLLRRNVRFAKLI